MKKLLLLLLIINSVFLLKANNPSGLQIYGYLSHQVKLDTYRSIDTRDGELYFYPLRANLDANGNDINKKSKLNMVEVQSRIGLRNIREDFMGAKLKGVLEADFFGTSQQLVRMLRIRQAVISLRWQKHELLIGNTFHPSFVLECFPNTVSFAAAVPFHPLNRSPQLRYTYHPTSNFNASISALVHGYHRSAGPSEAQKNSGLPDIQLRLQLGDGKRLSAGLLAGYKFLTPRDQTNAGLSTTETIGSYNLQAYLIKTFHKFTLKSEVIYGQNLTNFVMIGGYGARGKEDNFDWDGDYKYSNINTISTWVDLEANLSAIEFGVFAGYTANLGSDHDYISMQGYSRNDDLAHVFRISPRVQFHHQGLSFGFEWSVVGAAYGLEFDSRHKVIKAEKPTVNNQFIFSTMYKF